MKAVNRFAFKAAVPVGAYYLGTKNPQPQKPREENKEPDVPLDTDPCLGFFEKFSWPRLVKSKASPEVTSIATESLPPLEEASESSDHDRKTVFSLKKFEAAAIDDRRAQRALELKRMDFESRRMDGI